MLLGAALGVGVISCIVHELPALPILRASRSGSGPAGTQDAVAYKHSSPQEAPSRSLPGTMASGGHRHAGLADIQPTYMSARASSGLPPGRAAEVRPLSGGTIGGGAITASAKSARRVALHEASLQDASTPAAAAGNGQSASEGPQRTDDDVIARRLKSAAEAQSDPQMRARLWHEYEVYSAGAADR
jgi:hypothetical protein